MEGTRLKYKLLAIDMDGTLLDSKNQVSQRTREAIIKAKEKGVYIILSTGRILKSALYYSKDLGLNNPIIASNGGVVVDEFFSIIYKKTIDKNSIVDLINIANEDNMYYHFYDERNFYSNKRVQEVLDFYNESDNGGNSDFHIELKVFKDIKEITSNKDINIYKFLFVDEDMDKLDRFRKRLALVNNISISSSWPNNVETMSINVSKGEALKKLCKRLNIRSEEVIAIGDSENDLSMLNFAGLSVAMKNATKDIKVEVDHITDLNDNHGVAKVIEKFILEQEN